MSNPSLLPGPGAKQLLIAEAAPRAAAASPAKTPTAMPSPITTGPRKLVRPKLPVRTNGNRNYQQHNLSPILAHEIAIHPAAHSHETSHAEVFYFQKQVQTQTLMTFVLEDNEVIEGYIEWYDRDVIKVRNGSRTLIYKSGIKYLYKSGENH